MYRNSAQAGATTAPAGRDAAVVGDDGWAVAPRRDGARDAFKIETSSRTRWRRWRTTRTSTSTPAGTKTWRRGGRRFSTTTTAIAARRTRAAGLPPRARRPDAYADAVADDAYDAVADPVFDRRRAEGVQARSHEFDAASAPSSSPEAEAEKAAEKAAKMAEEAEREGGGGGEGGDRGGDGG